MNKIPIQPTSLVKTENEKYLLKILEELTDYLDTLKPEPRRNNACSIELAYLMSSIRYSSSLTHARSVVTHYNVSGKILRMK